MFATLIAFFATSITSTEAQKPKPQPKYLPKPSAEQVFRYVSTVIANHNTDRAQAVNVLGLWLGGKLEVSVVHKASKVQLMIAAEKSKKIRKSSKIECALCITACCGLFKCNPFCIAGCLGSPLCKN